MIVRLFQIRHYFASLILSNRNLSLHCPSSFETCASLSSLSSFPFLWKRTRLLEETGFSYCYVGNSRRIVQGFVANASLHAFISSAFFPRSLNFHNQMPRASQFLKFRISNLQICDPQLRNGIIRLNHKWSWTYLTRKPGPPALFVR